MTNYGDTPYVLRGGQVNPKKLFYSNPQKALFKHITIPAGYGVLPAGTVMGEITESTNRKGQFVPTTPREAATGLSAGLNTLFGAAYILDNGGDADAGIFYTTMIDSYKFAVGDHVFALDSDGTEIDLGAIVTIDRATFSHKAKITASTHLTAGITVANGGLVAIQTKVDGVFQAAKGILAITVDTGVGANAKGAQGSMIISNAQVYYGCTYNCTTNEISELGGSLSGQILTLK